MNQNFRNFKPEDEPGAELGNTNGTSESNPRFLTSETTPVALEDTPDRLKHLPQRVSTILQHLKLRYNS